MPIEKTKSKSLGFKSKDKNEKSLYAKTTGNKKEAIEQKSAKPTRTTSSKKDRTVKFNERVKTIHVESYKRYNVVDDNEGREKCCSSGCEMF